MCGIAGIFLADGAAVDRYLLQRMNEAIRHRGDLTGAYRVLTVSAAMSGDTQTAAAALAELRRTQPAISLSWIATQLPWRSDADREHFLEGFRRAGLT